MFLNEAESFISTKQLIKLHKFRQRMADLYGLADKDNDYTLYASLGELDELWRIISGEINNIKDDEKKKEAKKWMRERELSMD